MTAAILSSGLSLCNTHRSETLLEKGWKFHRKIDLQPNDDCTSEVKEGVNTLAADGRVSPPHNGQSPYLNYWRWRCHHNHSR